MNLTPASLVWMATMGGAAVLNVTIGLVSQLPNSGVPPSTVQGVAYTAFQATILAALGLCLTFLLNVVTKWIDSNRALKQYKLETDRLNDQLENRQIRMENEYLRQIAKLREQMQHQSARIDLSAHAIDDNAAAVQSVAQQTNSTIQPLKKMNGGNGLMDDKPTPTPVNPEKTHG